VSEFAKLFGEGETQLVVIKQADDEGRPEVRTFFQADGLGVSSIAISFKDTEGGWKSADTVFDALTEEKARKVVNDTLTEIGVEV